MVLRIALFALPTVAIAALVLVLNGLGASAGIAVVALSAVAVVSGASFGYFADRLPEFPRTRRPPRSTSMHHK